MTRDPALRALAEALRSPETDERVSALAALPPSTPAGVWVGVLIADASLRVRDLATERLAQRDPEAQAALPAPQGPLNVARRERLFGALAEDLAFLTILLAYPRGQHLLGLTSLERCTLDDGLLALARVASPQELRELLALPVNLSGRGLDLFRQLPTRPEGERAAFLEQLVWQCLQDLGPSGQELDRAQEALGAWVEGLASLGAAAPPFAAWLAAGGELQRGPVTHRFAAPGPEVLAALAPLARLFELLFGGASATAWRSADELRDELSSPLAELRVLAWQRLLEADLVDADRVVETLGDEAPGAVVSLLDLTRGRLTPRHAGRLRALAVHPRATVREALARALASQPLVAALVAAGVDPRSPGASLGILLAQPPELADAALAAYLEVERPAPLAVRALRGLREPPSSGWARWPELLAHDDPRVQAAAAAALVLLPTREEPGIRALWPALREASPAAALSALVRYDLPAPSGILEATLLRAAVAPREVEAGLALLRARPSWGHQLVGWQFVVGRGAGARYATRALRLKGLDVLAELDEPARPREDAGDDPEWLTGQTTSLVPWRAARATRRPRPVPARAGPALRPSPPLPQRSSTAWAS
ncbi:MAG: hypothetical protein R3F62_26815 [Planctomycetota bacterium]